MNFFYQNNSENLKKKITFFLTKKNTEKIIEILKNFLEEEKIIEKTTELLIILFTEKSAVEEFFHLGILAIFEDFLENSKNLEIIENVIWGLGNCLMNDSDDILKKVFDEIFLGDKILDLIKFFYKKKNVDFLFDAFVIFWSYYLERDLKFGKLKNDFFLILEYFLFVKNDYRNLDEILNIVEKCFFFAFEEDKFFEIFENFHYPKFLEKIVEIFISSKTRQKNKIQIIEILKITFETENPKTLKILKNKKILEIIEKNFETPNLEFFKETSNFLNSLILYSDDFLEKLQIDTKILEKIFQQIEKISKKNPKLLFLLKNLEFLYKSNNLPILNFYLKNEKTAGILVEKLDNKNSTDLNELIFRNLRNVLDVGEISKNRHFFEGNFFVEFLRRDSGFLEILENLRFNDSEDVRKMAESIIYYYFDE